RRERQGASIWRPAYQIGRLATIGYKEIFISACRSGNKQRSFKGPSAFLAEATLDQFRERVHHSGGVASRRGDADAASGAGGEHHQAHDGGAADLVAVLFH